MKIHPWNESQWQSLLQSGQELPQVLLLSGLLGLGKNRFALSLAETLLCQHPGLGPICQDCRSCHLLGVGSHPDFHVLSAGEQSALPDLLQHYRKRYEQDEVKPSKVKMQIPVARIHRLTEALFSCAHTASCKVVLISPAERMNISAANALLKFLEEPVGNTYLLLVSHQAERLPATIRSRCVSIPFRAPQSEQAINWLQHQRPDLSKEVLQSLLDRAGQAPLTAVQLAGQQQQAADCALDVEHLFNQKTTASEVAEKWQKKNFVGENLQHLQRLLAEMIRFHSSAQVDSSSDQSAVKLTTLFASYDRACKARQDVQSGLDTRLLVEDLLLTLSGKEQ